MVVVDVLTEFLGGVAILSRISALHLACRSSPTESVEGDLHTEQEMLAPRRSHGNDPAEQKACLIYGCPMGQLAPPFCMAALGSRTSIWKEASESKRQNAPRIWSSCSSESWPGFFLAARRDVFVEQSCSPNLMQIADSCSNEQNKSDTDATRRSTVTSASEKSRAAIVIVTQSLAKVCNSAIVNYKCMGTHHRSVHPALGLCGGSTKFGFVLI